MTTARAIDAALERGQSPASVARFFGVGLMVAERRAVIMAEKRRIMAEITRERRVEARVRQHAETTTKDRLAQWLALPLHYENDPRSKPWRPSGRTISRPISEHRSLGGVAVYATRDE